MSLTPLGFSPNTTPSFSGLVLSYSQHPWQGIERLQRKNQPRDHMASWESVKEACGGDFSLAWFSPFTRPCQPNTPIDKDLVRQVSSMTDMDNVTTTKDQSEDTKDQDSVDMLDE